MAEVITTQIPNITIQYDTVAAFCRRNHIVKLSLFGSVLRGDFGADSDVDVLVEFEPGHVPGFKFFSLQDELGELLGRRVDLNTPQSISKYFREEVTKEQVPLYVQAIAAAR